MMRRRIHIVLVGVHEELKYVWILLARDDGLMANCSPTPCSVTRGSWRPYFFLLAVKRMCKYDSLNLACEIFFYQIWSESVSTPRLENITPAPRTRSLSSFRSSSWISDQSPMDLTSHSHVPRLSRRLNFSGDMNKKEVIWMHPNPTLCR